MIKIRLTNICLRVSPELYVFFDQQKINKTDFFTNLLIDKIEKDIDRKFFIRKDTGQPDWFRYLYYNHDEKKFYFDFNRKWFD